MKHLFLAIAVISAGCGGNDAFVDGSNESSDTFTDSTGQKFSSVQGTLMDFTFESSLLVPSRISASSARSYIDAQMLYTIGHLNTDKSVGRLDKIQIANVRTAVEGTGTRVTFTVKLPVSWGTTTLPTSYAFTLPLNMGYSELETFTEKYKHDCVDFGAHDVDSGSLWYYWRPRNTACKLGETEVVKFTARAEKSLENTTGRYPEYHKVWEDQLLKVVSIFGKYEDGATTSSDAGIAAYNAFIAALKREFTGVKLETVPATVPTSPGIATPDITFKATLADGRRIEVTALLVDNVRTAPATFDTRYAELSTRADLIAYNGHAGLGANVRALAKKGRFVAGQYAIFFLNGCDTFAYVDGTLATDRARLNPDDPTGSKYMEIVTNAMPAFFSNMPNATLALMRGLRALDAPLTYQQMFKNIDKSQVVVVTGEEDNLFHPGYGANGSAWSKVETGFVARGEELRYETPSLPMGNLTVTLAHDANQPGGNANLAVRVGSAPTATLADCRPNLSGSNETCSLAIKAGAKVFVSVTGASTSSSAFVLSMKLNSPSGPAPWAGLDASGTVARNVGSRFETTLLQPGKYVFAITGTGDADLYVRAGTAPTSTAYDCRPYKSGSAETCTLNLTAPSTVHVMVQGYAASSNFTLTGRPQ